ncbi:MAG: hypothetical protein ABIN89_23640 [Chitinophagaceae bacterium]
MSFIQACSHSLLIFKNTSSNGKIFFAEKIILKLQISNYLNLDIGDLDDDGKNDLAIVDGANKSMSILLNRTANGLITFEPKVTLRLGHIFSFITRIFRPYPHFSGIFTLDDYV